MVCPPFFEKAPSLQVRPDGSVLFECMCNANPEPTIKWFFKDKELTPGDKYVMKQKKMVGKWAVTMNLKNPQQSDQGIYKVVATNSAGTHFVEQNYVAICTSNDMFKQNR